MLHHVPLRSARTTDLLICDLVLLALAVALSCFFGVYAANWDIVLLHLFAVVLLCLPLPPLLICFYGHRSLQVEHAGVVMGTFLGKRPWRLLVWRAEQVRAFDWERQSDGVYALRLLIRRAPHESASFVTVLHTLSAEQLAAVWQDFELHYPGSARREAPVPGELFSPAYGGTRFTGASALILAMALAAGTWQTVVTPLAVSRKGHTTPAVVTALRWDTPLRSGDYHLEVCPAGAEQTLRSATAFHQGSPMPQEGLTLAVVWADDCPFFYTTAEVLPMLMPLCCSGAVLLLGVLGLCAVARRS